MKRLALHAACWCLLAACRAAPPAQAHAPEAAKPASDAPEKDEHEAHEELPSRIRLTAEAEKDARLRLEEVKLSRLAPTVDLTGEIVPDPDQMARLAARATGRVVEVRFKEGDLVEKGAVMVVLDSTELARARAMWTGAAARAEAAQSAAVRLAAMAQQGLVPSQQAATAEAEAKALVADATAARQALSSFGVGVAQVPPDEASRLVLRAPISGAVVMRNAVVGDAVTPELSLATLVNLGQAYFQARLFERNLAQVQAGRQADVRLHAYPDAVLSGVVESVGHQVDPVARTVVARIAVKNTNGTLRVGLFGTARVVVDHGANAGGNEVLTVPTSAVTRLDGNTVAFVANPDGQFEVHPVTLGASAAGRVEVLRGLTAGEKVVVEGVFSLKSVVLKSTFGEEEH